MIDAEEQFYTHIFNKKIQKLPELSEKQTHSYIVLRKDPQREVQIVEWAKPAWPRKSPMCSIAQAASCVLNLSIAHSPQSKSHIYNFNSLSHTFGYSPAPFDWSGVAQTAFVPSNHIVLGGLRYTIVQLGETHIGFICQY